MFRWLIGSSLEFRFAVLTAAIVVYVLGAFQVEKMPINIFPEFKPTVVEVQSEAYGMTAEDVKDLVTIKIEELLSGVPWLKSISSRSVTGLSSVKLTFEPGTNLIEARQMIQERLAATAFVGNVAKQPTIIQPTSATSRLMMVGMSSDKINANDLSIFVRWFMKPRLAGLPGVANVAIWGQRLREMEVQIDTRRFRDNRILELDVVTSAGDAMWTTPLSYLKGGTPGTGGWMDNKNQRISLVHVMPVATPEDMAKLPISPPYRAMKGLKMELGDVAELAFTSSPVIGDAFVNDGPGLLLVVEKYPSANTAEVTAEVRKALAELQLGLPDVKIDTNIFQLATYIEDSFGNLTQALIFGFVLVVLGIGAFMFNWRSAIVGLVSIPLSLLAAVLVLQWTGTTFNIMILAGLVVALGVVIDDVIIGLDRLMERLRERKEGDDTTVANILLESTLETRGSLGFAALIVLLAISPLIFIGGVSGSFFEPMVAAYALAVVASIIVGLTVTPVVCLMLFRSMKPGAGGGMPLVAALRGIYDAMLNGVVKAPRAVAGVALVLVVAGLATWPLLGKSLLPTFKEKVLVVNAATAPGTSNEETFRMISRLGKELKTLPGVRNIGAHLGRAITGDRIVDVNSAQIWVGLTDDADYDEMTAKVRKTVDGYIGLDRSVQSYLRDTVNEALSAAPNDLIVRIYGTDYGVLNQKAEEVRKALSGVEGLVDLRAAPQLVTPQVKINVDLQKAAAASVKPGEVRRAAATVFAGLPSGALYEEGKSVDVIVRGAPEVRRSLRDVEDVQIAKSNQHYIRLGDVAEVTMEPTALVVRRDNISLYVDVTANVSGRDLSSVNREVESKLSQVNFPLEYFPKILGEPVEQENVQQRTMWIAIAALVGIFVLLQACFASWRLAAIGFVCIPAAIAGGVLAGFATGGVVTLGSAVGFLAVTGIVSRNAIVLITHYRRLRDAGVAFGVDLVVRGARERMPSVLTSSIAIIAVLLPIAFMGSVPGLEIVHPTAIVMIAGVIASTLITLVVVPALYLLFGANAGRRADPAMAAA